MIGVNCTGTPDSGDPTATLAVGNLVAGQDFRLAELVIYDEILSASAQTNLASYFAARYGL